MSTNGNILRYYIVLVMKGLKKPFRYEVGSEEIERCKNVLDMVSGKSGKLKNQRFFCFAAVNRISVAVSVYDIQLAHFLWEKAMEQNDEDDEPGREGVHFYFRNKLAPYKAGFDNPVDAASLHIRLDSGEFSDSEFFSFLDIDGEEVWVRFNELVLVEFSTPTLDEGHEESLRIIDRL
jgi:hypothetical protein